MRRWTEWVNKRFKVPFNWKKDTWNSDTVRGPNKWFHEPSFQTSREEESEEEEEEDHSHGRLAKHCMTIPSSRDFMNPKQTVQTHTDYWTHISGSLFPLFFTLGCGREESLLSCRHCDWNNEYRMDGCMDSHSFRLLSLCVSVCDQRDMESAVRWCPQIRVRDWFMNRLSRPFERSIINKNSTEESVWGTREREMNLTAHHRDWDDLSLSVFLSFSIRFCLYLDCRLDVSFMFFCHHFVSSIHSVCSTKWRSRL